MAQWWLWIKCVPSSMFGHMMCSCGLIGDDGEHVVYIAQGPTSKVTGDDIECGVSVA